APAFPYGLRQQVSEAKVTLEFIVDANGEVVAPMVTDSSHRGFDDAAIIGVSKWKFRPGMKAGRKVNTRVRQAITFTVGDE
ncbi:MAG TPA: TonB family protein, partial [Acidobacteriota bacterium]|nr:TonB family protein [Acidobacteriota bacterium]